MDWVFSKWKPGRLQRWEFLLPPGSAKETQTELESAISSPYLPRTNFPKANVFPEKFILEKANFRQALEILARFPWVRDFRINLGKFYMSEDFSFSGLQESLREASLLPDGWQIRFHPQSRGRAVASREELQILWEEAYGKIPVDSTIGNFTELNALCVGEDLILSLSLAGEPLFKHGGFAPLSKSAPIREDMARFLLSELKKILPDPDAVLVPFAGSGTFVWESAFHIFGLGFPHYDRSYVFEDLGEFPIATWEFLKRKISETAINKTVILWWNEKEADAASYLRERGSRFQEFLEKQRSGLQPPTLASSEKDFFSLSPREIWISLGKPAKIWMPLNPPYGLRIRQENVFDPYRQLAEILKEWRKLPAEIAGFLLCPDETSWSSFVRTSGMETKTVHVTHGGIDLRVVYF